MSDERSDDERLALRILAFFYGQMDAAMMWNRATDAERAFILKFAHDLRPILQRTMRDLSEALGRT